MYLVEQVFDTNPKLILAKKISVSQKTIDGKSLTIIKGLLVLATEFSDAVPELELVSGRETYYCNWTKKTTGQLHQKFPDALNSKYARFTFPPIPSTGPEKLYLSIAAKSGREKISLVKFSKWPTESILSIRSNIEMNFKRGLQGQTHIVNKCREELKKFTSAEKETTEWVQCSILLDAVERTKKWKTHKQIAIQCRLLREMGKTNDADKLTRALANATYPSVLTAHGYSMHTFRNMEDHRPVWNEIVKITALLNGLGYESFINSGTLLGATREGKLIGHDDDVDLALILNAGSAAAAAIEWFKLKEALASLGIFDMAVWSKSRSKVFKLGGLKNIKIDLFPAWVENGNFYVYPHTFGELEVEDVLPLKIGLSKGIYVPNKAELMLAINYGKNWRISDPNFHFDWDTAKRKFKGFGSQFEALVENAG